MPFCAWLYADFLKRNSVPEGCNLDRMEKLLLNKPLPMYDFVDFNGGNINENITSGKVLLIFLQTGCGACQDEMKLLTENFDDINNEVKVIGIAADSKENIQQFIKDFNLKLPIFIDRKSYMFSVNRIACTPTNFLIDNGIVKQVRIGGFDDISDLKESL